LSPAPGGYTAAQAVLLATFAALVMHTMMYAAFLEDPLTWVILGTGVAVLPPAQARVARGRPRVPAQATPATA
jgi:hypothetical protein